MLVWLSLKLQHSRYHVQEQDRRGDQQRVRERLACIWRCFLQARAKALRPLLAGFRYARSCCRKWGLSRSGSGRGGGGGSSGRVRTKTLVRRGRRAIHLQCAGCTAGHGAKPALRASPPVACSLSRNPIQPAWCRNLAATQQMRRVMRCSPPTSTLKWCRELLLIEGATRSQQAG